MTGGVGTTGASFGGGTQAVDEGMELLGPVCEWSRRSLWERNRLV
jgi:hypothetical protein